MDIHAVTEWFAAHKRNFPWRERPSPYAVLVSEIMLQQTQASRVIPFFNRWINEFPSLQILAEAPEKSVMKAWEGLGYYSRARALHRGAKIIVERFNGKIPDTRKELLTISGIGPYTAGAILAFAFRKKAAAVDANVVRVLARCTETHKSARMFEPIVENLLPSCKPWAAMEALIELGALTCKKKPLCEQCPLANDCLARKNGTTALFPPPNLQQKTPLWRDVAVIVTTDTVLVCHRTGKRIMSGLCEFPFFESSPSGRGEGAFLDHLNRSDLSIIGSLHPITHSFTRYRATLYPVLFSSLREFSWPEGRWLPMKGLKEFAFSSGHKQVMEKALLLLKRNRGR